MMQEPTTERQAPASGLRTRLLPLYAGVGLQGFMLWVPVEKLFLNEIGFDPASIGLMAAAYAAVVPLVEVPSGVLADRWSRRGVLVISSVALALTALVGGLSANVATYIVSAVMLGVYYAMYSGTMDAVVYDTVLEELGDSATFERHIGRIRAVESALLVTGALAGGWVANITSPRVTYFLTVPFAVLSAVAYLRFCEPRLHQPEEPEPLRRQLALTYRTLLRTPRLLPVVALTVLTALLLQAVFEFGPLWLVAVAVPAVVYGPYWAGLVASLGFGGLLAGRIPLDRPVVIGVAVVALPAVAVTLTTGAPIVAVIVAQVLLATLLAVANIHVTHRLHDAVPSAIRSGVASGVGALSWLVFLPFALVSGVVTDRSGVATTGMLLTGVAALVGALWLLVSLRRGPATAAAQPAVEPVAEPVVAGTCG